MNNVYNNGIDLSVTANGRPMRIYSHEGRYFIESREGTEYFIEIKNNNPYRVEVVVAVDGLSVMNGEKATITDYGYVIGGHESIKIKGYRKSMDEVGGFKFTARETSYAASKGDSTNVGVIAVAVWKEKTVSNIGIRIGEPTFILTGEPTYTTTTGYVHTTGTSGILRDVDLNNSITTGSLSAYNTTRCCVGSNDGPKGRVGPSGCEGVVTAYFSHGTTWGDKIADKVVTTSFERGVYLGQTEIFYNSKENLQAMGIKIVQEKLVNFPSGFPGSFANPPVGWKS